MQKFQQATLKDKTLHRLSEMVVKNFNILTPLLFSGVHAAFLHPLLQRNDNHSLGLIEERPCTRDGECSIVSLHRL